MLLPRPIVSLLLLLRLAACLEIFFEEYFSDSGWKDRWVHSKWKGLNGRRADFEWSRGPFYADTIESLGLRTVQDMSYNIISAKFPPFSNKGRELIIQFSARQFYIKHGHCGGAYMKVLGTEFDQDWFNDTTPLIAMFGPDICGYDFAHHHMTFAAPHGPIAPRKKNKIHADFELFTRFYTLQIKPDDTYVFYIDYKPAHYGHMRVTHDFPPQTKDDPKDKKPRKWDDRARIPHPKQKHKPEEWHDEKVIPDPDSVMPAMWNEKEDGPWKAPMIKNPQYKGIWKKRLVKNPNYKGKWIAKQIPHEHYRDEVHAFNDWDIGGVGFELWTAHNGTIFDNILLCDDLDYAKTIFDKWVPFRTLENETQQKYYAHLEDNKKNEYYGAWDLADEEEEVEEEEEEDVDESGQKQDEDEEEEEATGAPIIREAPESQQRLTSDGPTSRGSSGKPTANPANYHGDQDPSPQNIPKGMEGLYENFNKMENDQKAHEL